MVEYPYGLFCCLGNDGSEPGQDRDVVILSAILAGPGLDVGVIGLRALECRLAGEVPACRTTGWPWGGRLTLSGPATSKLRPL
jgi:hypothetical protein